jgi:hypothetical protein
LKNQILIIKSRGGRGAVKRNWTYSGSLRTNCKKKVGMAVACWCWLVILLREADQHRRGGYETCGKQPDEEGGEEVVPIRELSRSRAASAHTGTRRRLGNSGIEKVTW